MTGSTPASPPREPKWHWHTSWSELGFIEENADFSSAVFQLLPAGSTQDDRATTVAKAHFPPGRVVETHQHGTAYTEIILEGSLTVGRTQYGPGDIRVVGPNTAYGPTIYGPEGGTVLLVFAEGDRSATYLTPRNGTRRKSTVGDSTDSNVE